MALQPWIRARIDGGRAGCAAFNGATASQPWIPDIRKVNIRLIRRCFNGATASQPWIRSSAAPRRPRTIAFNGAMTFQPWIRDTSQKVATTAFVLQWSHGLSAMDTARAARRSTAARRTFNGAMTFQPWIRVTLTYQKPTSQTLQWSHDLSAMDTTTVSPPVCLSSLSFNGAMTFQPWIPPARRYIPSSRESPSMEP